MLALLTVHTHTIYNLHTKYLVAPQTTIRLNIFPYIIHTHKAFSQLNVLTISSAGHKQRKQTKRDSFSVGIRGCVSECVCKIQKLQHLSLKINNGLNTKYTYAISRTIMVTNASAAPCCEHIKGSLFDI